MANWNNPVLASLYVDVLNELKDRDVDNLKMIHGTNVPVNSKRWDDTSNTFQVLAALPNNYATMIISVAGGGTGANTTAAARTNLGLGSMATQNSNAVAITGGTITGVNLDGGSITSGIVALARGGTSASLALGPAGSMMGSSGAAVVFTFQGDQLVNLNASSISQGFLALARLASGGTWALTTPLVYSLTGTAYVQMFGASLIMGAAGGGNLGNGTINVSGGFYVNGVLLTSGEGIPSGLMAYFDGGCPAGWSFVAASQGRVIRSINGGGGGTGGADNHNHGVVGPTDQPDVVNTGSVTIPGFNAGMDTGGGVNAWLMDQGVKGVHFHSHPHAHQVNFQSQDASSWPSYVEYTLCRKN